ncbi:MAG: TlpA family protein disulfide reductase [Bacteroidia bacterium]|nr:TlpA family protein disulfide reductase [Bacteroidia bacterium]
MIRRIFLFIVVFSVAHFVNGQNAELVKLEKLKAEIVGPSDQILVYNFWATWCAPCVKELPLFEKLNEDNKEVKVTLVSMDIDLDPNPAKVYKFVDRKKIQSRVIILDAVDPNSWINQIDKNWSGALPATLIINTKTGERKFINNALKDGELETLIAEIKS